MGSVHCDAVLFDLDGVLVDSMRVIERVVREWAAGHGLDGDQAVNRSHGRRDVDMIRLLAPHLDEEAEADRITAIEERDFAGIRASPGSAELLGALPDGRWAVVTSGTRNVAEGRMAAAGIPRPTHLVAAEDVARGKPDPEGYLLAAQLLGVPIGRCAVVEDALAGVEAALVAGAHCIGLGQAVAGCGHGTVGWVEDLRQLEAVRSGAGVLLRITTPPS